MTTAIVLGVNGQDGTFLAKHLLAKEYAVVGLGRQDSARWKINSPLFTYYQLDLRKTERLSDLLTSLKPGLIFHVAAVHTSAGGSYEPIFNDALQVNVASVHSILEYLRRINPEGRLIYASSAKVFGEPYPAVVDETTPVKNACLYSITKNTAFHLIHYYRQQHATKASVIYLFNHESELRPAEYFIPKVLECLAAAKRDRSHATPINTFDFYCDWGSAEEYTSLMINIIESAPQEDFVLGTGVPTYAKDLVSKIFNQYGLDYKQHFIEINRPDFSTSQPYKVNIQKLQRKTGRVPTQNIYDVCNKILKVNHNLQS